MKFYFVGIEGFFASDQSAKVHFFIKLQQYLCWSSILFVDFRIKKYFMRFYISLGYSWE